MINGRENRNISIKEINKKNILKLVIDMGPISRIDISRRLKISRPTTTAYISELIEVILPHSEVKELFFFNLTLKLAT